MAVAYCEIHSGISLGCEILTSLAASCRAILVFCLSHRTKFRAREANNQTLRPFAVFDSELKGNLINSRFNSIVIRVCNFLAILIEI